jgi:hypothetical protein
LIRDSSRRLLKIADGFRNQASPPPINISIHRGRADEIPTKNVRTARRFSEANRLGHLLWLPIVAYET